MKLSSSYIPRPGKAAILTILSQSFHPLSMWDILLQYYPHGYPLTASHAHVTAAKMAYYVRKQWVTKTVDQYGCIRYALAPSVTVIATAPSTAVSV